MEQIKKLLARLSLAQKLSLGVVALLVVGGLAVFSQLRHEGDFRPLYTGLSAEDAGAVVQKLKESGTEFRLSESGTTVLAPSARLAELRLQLAASGLPKSGRMGFELFDKTSFGATDFAEHVNYRRALEGELERSIGSLAEVERARVHLTFPKESVYLESRQPAKASVVLGLRPGAQLSAQNVQAVCNLLASAVEGLAPEAVSVIDTRGNLLNRPRKSGGDAGLESSEANLEYREAIEKSLLSKIHSTLEPLLGTDRFRATVSAECDFTSGDQSEESFDPSRSVMVSSQKSEDVAPAFQTAGVPGTASNLPNPPARPAGAASGASRRTEEINYQSSRLVKRVKLPQGELKRVSVSLLLDQDVRWEGKAPHLQQVLVPPSPDKLKVIRDLVAGVIGLQPDRGDQLIVETLPFEATLHSEPPAPPPGPGAPPAAPAGRMPAWLHTPKGIATVAGGAIVLLALAVVGMRVLRRRPAGAVTSRAALPSADKNGSPEQIESMEKAMEEKMASQAQLQARLESEALEAIKAPAPVSNKKDALTKYLRESMKKDPVVHVQTLRTWLNERA